MTTGRDVSWNASWRCSKKSQSGRQVADCSVHSTTNARIYFFLSLLWMTLVLEPCIEVRWCSCVSGSVEPARSPALHLYWSETVQLCVRYSQACQDTCIAPVLKWDGTVVCQVQSSLPGHLHSGFWITPKRPYLRLQNVLSTSKFCFSGASKRPDLHDVRYFRVAGIQPLSEWQQTGTHYTFPVVQAQQHRVITAAGQLCMTKQSLQSASGRSGLGCTCWQHDISIYTYKAIAVPSMLMSLVINTPCSSREC